MARPKVYATLMDRIIANSTTIPWSGCYVYTGPCNGSGHGYISYRMGSRLRRTPMTVAVHRYVYWLVTGKWPDLLRHRCNVPSCWRYDHLIEGTQKENVADQIANGTNINQIRWKKIEDQQLKHIKDIAK